jgi:UPF0755 protein
VLVVAVLVLVSVVLIVSRLRPSVPAGGLRSGPVVIGASPTPRSGPGTIVTADVTVKNGDTLADVADKLEAAHIINSASMFRAQVRLRGMDTTIQAGLYHFNDSMSIDEIITTLQNGPDQAQTSVLFKEGLRVEEDARALENAHVLKADDYISAAGNADAFKTQYPLLASVPPGGSLNGYLFPDTYFFAPTAASGDVIAKQLNRFQQLVTPAMIEQATNQQHSLEDVIIIASIVEREAQVASERPIIAGVYWNRLKDDQGLFADPTVQYALGWSPEKGTWWRVLSLSDLQVDSPYNTYKNKGLPPGPICNPGLASINAALNPEGDFYYMVAKGDGSGTHAFAKTLEAHNANRAKYGQ